MFKNKRYQEARDLFEEVIQGFQKIFGRESQNAVEVTYWLIRTLRGQQHHKEAETLSQEAFGLLRGKQETDKKHPEWPRIKFWIARIRHEQRQYQDAEALLRETHQDLEKKVW
jgi:TolA-binding protein